LTSRTSMTRPRCRARLHARRRRPRCRAVGPGRAFPTSTLRRRVTYHLGAHRRSTRTPDTCRSRRRCRRHRRPPRTGPATSRVSRPSSSIRRRPASSRSASARRRRASLSSAGRRAATHAVAVSMERPAAGGASQRQDLASAWTASIATKSPRSGSGRVRALWLTEAPFPWSSRACARRRSSIV
jgi:hypothetical protein